MSTQSIGNAVPNSAVTASRMSLFQQQQQMMQQQQLQQQQQYISQQSLQAAQSPQYVSHSQLQLLQQQQHLLQMQRQQQLQMQQQQQAIFMQNQYLQRQASGSSTPNPLAAYYYPQGTSGAGRPPSRQSSYNSGFSLSHLNQQREQPPQSGTPSHYNSSTLHTAATSGQPQQPSRPPSRALPPHLQPQRPSLSLAASATPRSSQLHLDVAQTNHYTHVANASANYGAGTRTVDRYGFIGGEQFSDPNFVDSRVTVDKIRSRETKWLKMLNTWDAYMSKNFPKVRSRCRKGIPPAVRSRAWQHLCGSRKLIYENRGIYQALLNSPGDPKTIDQVQKDVSRQYPQHEVFRSENSYGQRALFNVLKAYTILQPRVGYCQAHAPIAAALLIHMPEEEAFWTFFRICDRYMPGYYDEGFERIQLDAKVFMALVKKYLPAVHKHLTRLDINPILFMLDWFLCLFTRNLPWASVVRVLDQFFCEGMKVIFRFALAILKAVLGESSQRENLNSMEETLQILRNLPPQVTAEAFIVNQALYFVKITPEVLEREHRRQWRLTHDSSVNAPRSRAADSGNQDRRSAPAATQRASSAAPTASSRTSALLS